MPSTSKPNFKQAIAQRPAWSGCRCRISTGYALGPVDQEAKDLFAPLVKKAALVMSFNEAWLILGGIFAFAALLAIIVVSKSSDEETQQQQGR